MKINRLKFLLEYLSQLEYFEVGYSGRIDKVCDEIERELEFKDADETRTVVFSVESMDMENLEEKAKEIMKNIQDRAK